MKIKEIKESLTKKYFERSQEIEGILTAILARQHVLLIGPAGTGKSALSAELKNIVRGSNYFQWLLTRFSTPEELFGVLNLKELEKGVYKRNTSGKLPESHFAFLDEIFKANSAILNSLLTLINERLFYNNGTPFKSPLITLIGSSNEYPEEGEGLEALFDRFLLRFEVNYVKEESNFIQMLKGKGQDVELPSISLEELVQYQFMVDLVNIPDDVYEALAEIRRRLHDEGIFPSDRRFKQSLSLLRAKAFLEGRTEVVVNDIMLLANSLWETIDQKNMVTQIVRENAQDKVTMLIEEHSEVIESLIESIKNDTSTETNVEVRKKLKEIEKDLKEKVKDPTKIDKLLETISNTCKKIEKSILGI
jgi:MoxR-like ATPase